MEPVQHSLFLGVRDYEPEVGIDDDDPILVEWSHTCLLTVQGCGTIDSSWPEFQLQGPQFNDWSSALAYVMPVKPCCDKWRLRVRNETKRQHFDG